MVAVCGHRSLYIKTLKLLAGFSTDICDRILMIGKLFGPHKMFKIIQRCSKKTLDFNLVFCLVYGT